MLSPQTLSIYSNHFNNTLLIHFLAFVSVEFHVFESFEHKTPLSLL